MVGHGRRWSGHSGALGVSTACSLLRLPLAPCVLRGLRHAGQGGTGGGGGEGPGFQCPSCCTDLRVVHGQSRELQSHPQSKVAGRRGESWKEREMLCKSWERAHPDAPPALRGCEVTSRTPSVILCPKRWEWNSPIFQGHPPLGRKHVDLGPER